MQLDLLLLRHGAWLVPVLAAGVCALTLAASALHRAWRIQRGMRVFTSRLAGTRRGLRGAVAGDRVVAHGRAIVSGPGAHGFDAGAPCALASASLSAQEVSCRAPAIELRTGLRRAPLIGEARLHAAAEERDVDDLPHGLFLRLHEAGMRVEGSDPITLRHVRDGETVLVLGRARSVASGAGTTYREGAQRLGIGPDHDGLLHVVGLGRARTHVWRVARVGIPLGIVGAAALLLFGPLASLYAAPLPWTVAQRDTELPYRLWLPLASPWRAQALAHAGDWLLERGRWTRHDAHALEIAAALREVAPDCEREGALIEAFGWHVREGAVDGCDTLFAQRASRHLASSSSSSAREPLLALAAALDRGAEIEPDALAPTVFEPLLECAECGALSNGAPGQDAWVVADVLLDLDLRTARMRRFRGEWLGDLAILEAARGLPSSTIAAIVDGSERDPRDEHDRRRTRRAIELLANVGLIPTPGGGLHALAPTPSDLGRALLHARDSLPDGAALHARMDLYGARLTHWATGPRAVAVTLARIAVLVEEAGAPEAARRLAQLARRVAQGVDDESITRSVVLGSLQR